MSFNLTTELQQGVAAEEDERDFVLRCSPAQERFWFMDLLAPGDPSLNVAVRWRVEGRIEADLTELAFQRLIERHEALRTSFREVEGVPMQAIAPAASFRISEIDLSNLPEGDRLAEADRIGGLEAQQSFDLSKAPLLRVTILRLGRELAILLVTAHHIVCDGWSTGIMVDEFVKIYEAERKGGRPELRDLPIQYADYSAWQRDRLAPTELTREIAYWDGVLGGAKHFEMLTDLPRPPTRRPHGALVSRLLPPGLTDGLAELGRDRGATFFMSSLAVLLTMLHRVSGESDIGIGTQVAGRDRVELEPIVGTFINTLILRADLTGDRSFLSTLDLARDTVEGALDHQMMPIEHLVERLGGRRDPSRNPLFSVNFILQQAFVRPHAAERFTVAGVPSQLPGALYDLNFVMVRRAEGWRVSCEFSTDLFEESTAQDLLLRFELIMAAALAEPERAISTLPLMRREDHRLFQAWNETRASYPAGTPAHALFAEQATRTPDREAVVSGSARLTYRELDGASNRLARLLRGRGVGVGVPVGICLERSLDMLVGLLAIMKAGGIFVPLDPAYPADRLGWMMTDAGCTHLLIHAPSRGVLASDGIEVIDLDLDRARIAAERSQRLEDGEAGPDDLAYTIFTSGSTGRAKGVQIRHRSLVNELWSFRSSPGLGPNDAVLAITSLSFDPSLIELFLPLIVGARIIVADRFQVRDGHALRELVEQVRPTVVQATPTSWRLLIEAGWGGTPGLKMLCGGEALSRPLADQLLERGAELWNIYGPTETTVWASALRIEPGTGSIRVGPPISNMRFHVVDGHGSLVPVGVPGELLIGGEGLATGYAGRPDLTAERFVPDFLDAAPGRRLYRTGDRTRWRSDGTLEFLGRTDHQVKIRGFRIEVGEVEAALLRHPDLAEAAAVAVRREGADDHTLVAFASPKPGCTRDRGELRDELLRALPRSLPQFMVPSGLHILEELPKTPSRKIDRAALATLEPAPRAAETDVELTLVESEIRDIWIDLLGTSDIGPSDDFFDLGGHSLLGARMLARVEKLSGTRISLWALVEDSTLRGLAAAVSAGGREAERVRIARLHERGTRPQLIALHHTAVRHILYRPLADELGQDQPVVNFQILDTMERGSTPRMEDVAAEYCDALLRFQPEGTFRLAGFCHHGVLAYEVAQQLTRRGREVDQLVLIDSWAPDYLARLPRLRAWLARYSYRAGRGRAALRRMRGLTVGGFVRVVHDWAPVKRISRSLRRAASRVGSASQPAEEDFWRLTDRLAVIARGYRPKPYRGNIILFRTDGVPTGRFLDPKLGWADHFPADAECRPIPGHGHWAAFDKAGARAMAERLLALPA